MGKHTSPNDPTQKVNSEASDPTQQLAYAGSSLLSTRTADVGRARETRRKRRVVRTILTVVLAIISAYLVSKFVTFPTIDPAYMMIGVFFAFMIIMMLGQMVGTSKSPHVTFRPEQIDVGLDDVVGIDPLKDEVIRSINLFLAHKQFSTQMGGTPRRGLLFEGAPGTGKTHMAKAMAREAGVPFLFVSATSFQSMWYGATAKKIRSYFKALRKTALREGGAIGFIEEIDAIAMARSGLSMTALPMTGDLSGLQAAAANAGLVINSVMNEGTGGVVNELLVQMQSFDDPSGMQKLQAWFIDKVNLLLPVNRQFSRPTPQKANVLLIAATNRADNLDPALLRPGRFDRRLSFDAPPKASRAQLIEYFLKKKAHDAELDEPKLRDAFASVTQGYTPVMIENLLDEALVNALRRNAVTMNWADVEHARLIMEVGMGQPVEYTDHERELIATHEAGHATVAALVAPQRRLEVLTIIKRKDALGMLAHGDSEEVYTRSRAEMTALIEIAMGGQVAEELYFGDVSTGPAGDLQYATTVAAQMVGSAGMAGTLVSFGAMQSGGFGEPNLVGRVLSDTQGRAMVEEILNQAKDRVRILLTENGFRLEALRDALLEKHELIGEEITRTFDQAVKASV